jgi:hypothetical protein
VPRLAASRSLSGRLALTAREGVSGLNGKNRRTTAKSEATDAAMSKSRSATLTDRPKGFQSRTPARISRARRWMNPGQIEWAWRMAASDSSLDVTPELRYLASRLQH